MAKTATIDGELCIGSLECNRIAAMAFRLNAESGVSEALPGVVDTDAKLLIEAAGSCPTQAIHVLGEDGDVLYGASR